MSNFDSVMNKKTKKSIYEKAVRLVEGGIEEVDGHWVRAIKSPIDYHPCDICDMDSVCIWGDGRIIVDVCEECDAIGRWGYYLKLVCGS